MIIVITGNPGVGKHTVSESLAKELGYFVSDINKVALKSNTTEKSGDAYDVDTDRLQVDLKQVIKQDCIVVGHLAPYVLTKGQVDKVIVLRKNPYELIKVYSDRGYTQEKSNENIESEILGIVAGHAQDQFGDTMAQVDVSGKSTQDIIGKIRSILNHGENGDSVDWLSLVAQNNDLKKFFTY